jgi:hypothetical protein
MNPKHIEALKELKAHLLTELPFNINMYSYLTVNNSAINELPSKEVNVCASSACGIGLAYVKEIGFPLPEEITTFHEYSKFALTGKQEALWEFLFSCEWSNIEYTETGSQDKRDLISRIDYFLKFGASWCHNTLNIQEGAIKVPREMEKIRYAIAQNVPLWEYGEYFDEAESSCNSRNDPDGHEKQD